MTRDQWKNIFADNLVAILREKGMSQNQLAKDSGLSVSMISDYINGISTPGIPAIISLAYTLDVEVDDLIDFGDMIK